MTSREIVSDATIVAGLVVVTAGAALFDPRAGLIVGGLALAVIGYFWGDER